MTRMLKDILKEFFESREMPAEYDLGLVSRIWEKVMGDSIGRNAEVLSFKRGLLKIKTSNSVWRNELSLQKMEIIDQLNAELNEEKIRDIRFL